MQTKHTILFFLRNKLIEPLLTIFYLKKILKKIPQIENLNGKHYVCYF
jgi:hypothetical protein